MKIHVHFIMVLIFAGCTSTQQVRSPSYSQVQPPLENCYDKYQGGSDALICQNYWSNRDARCDNVMSGILQNRGVKISPREDCGISKTTQNVPSAFYMPFSENPQCVSFIAGLASKSSPILNACNARYKSLDDETILCRQELNQFINSNSKGTGSSFVTCGAPNDTLSSIAPLKTFNEFYKQGMNGITEYYKQFIPSVRSNCEKASKNGSSDGYFCLALLSKQDKKIDDYFDNVVAAAKLGNPAAQYDLSNVLAKSKKPDEIAEHKKYLMSAAIAGFPHAQVGVGWGYMDPKSTKHDYSKALYWNQKASDFGHGEGTSNLAMIFELGLGVTTNLTVASDLYRTAIYKKDRAWSGQAEIRLGQMLQKGKGLPVNRTEAAWLYRRVLNDLPQATKEHKAQAISNLKSIER
jgi:TPR repeat protein